ncbi:hypothetical protein GQ464_005735 [Rhodocaloribacter litoris]|uniref:hypothetical protein n=1 Tax=Rhodocaloribacter litoris TaxID=2558931 RepID=UPI00141E8779|nr:hypothetical protein [Rhodocaloribacter litoris]QXD16450.1 hypothetical protein GQ464_005735 [Rhodocaloribacter litoris]
MDPAKQPIDDQTLAAFMAGTLPVHRRREVVAQLARDPELRELLQMACEALEAARQAEALPAASVRPLTGPETGSPLRVVVPERPARKRPARLYRLGRYVAAAVVVVALGLGVWQAFIPSAPPDAGPLLRGEADEALRLSVPATLDELAFSWPAVPGADHYLLVVWDLEEAVPVARHRVETHRIEAGDAVARALQPLLKAGHPYAVRVDVFDVENRLMMSSGMVEFVLQSRSVRAE